MEMDNQRNFIMTPVHSLLSQASMTIACLTNGVETYPSREYILQSLFLRMTGFQEQKLKCICWEIASYDYEYRYRRILSNKLGECSSYSDKCAVYSDIASAIEKLNRQFNFKEFTSTLSCGDLLGPITEFYDCSRHLGWLEREYVSCSGFLWATMNSSCLASKAKDCIFGECKECGNKAVCSLHSEIRGMQSLVSVFNAAVYTHRNNCAHNVESYRRNQYTFSDLCEKGDRSDNYLLRFMLLMMIDYAITMLFKEWIQVSSKSLIMM